MSYVCIFFTVFSVVCSELFGDAGVSENPPEFQPRFNTGISQLMQKTRLIGKMVYSIICTILYYNSCGHTSNNTPFSDVDPRVLSVELRMAIGGKNRVPFSGHGVWRRWR